MLRRFSPQDTGTIRLRQIRVRVVVYTAVRTTNSNESDGGSSVIKFWNYFHKTNLIVKNISLFKHPFFYF